jgi:hypothetical protein
MYMPPAVTFDHTTPCGGGSEYLHRSPCESLEATKKEPSTRGYNWATLFLGDINTGTWPSRLGESQLRRWNMAVSSVGLRHESDCSGKAQKQFNSKLQTRALVREGVSHIKKSSIVRQIKEIWSWTPDGRLTPGRTGRLTVGRKLTSTSTFDHTVPS